jgi:hypothetical protein
MTAKKKKPVEMTNAQLLNHVIRLGAPPHVIVSTAKTHLQHCMKYDESEGPSSPRTMDTAMALWTLATAYAKLHAENETLQGKLRRGNRKPANKPAAELLKKTPETTPQPQAS